MKKETFEKATKINSLLNTINSLFVDIDKKTKAVQVFGDRCNVVTFTYEGGTINNLSIGSSPFLSEQRKKLFYEECRCFRQKIVALVEEEKQELINEFESLNN